MTVDIKGISIGSVIDFALRRTVRKASDRLPLGVDISASALRILQLDHGGGAIARWGMAPLSGDEIVDGRIVRPAAVVAALCAALDAAGRAGGEAYIALPNRAVAQLQMDLPLNLTDQDADWLALDAAAKYLHQPRAAIYHDHYRDAPDLPLRVVATRREPMDERIAVLRAARLRCGGVDIDHYAQLAGLRNQIAVLESRCPRPVIALLTRDGRSLQLWVLRDAGWYGAVHAVADLDLDTLIGGAQWLMNGYRANHPDEAIGVLLIEGLQQWLAPLAETLDLEVAVADPFVDLMPPAHGLPPTDGWARACGLARRACHV